MLLSVRVPANHTRGPHYMDQLLAAVHQGNYPNLPVSLEIGSLQEEVTLAWRFPKELRTLVQQQLFAHYPDCQVQYLPENALEPSPSNVTWGVDLWLAPSIYPCKRYGEFEDSINRVTADPLASILATFSKGRTDQLAARLEFSIRPARSHRITRGKVCLRRLASPFFAAYPELARFYAVAALSRWWPARCLASMLGLLARQREQPSYRDPIHSSGSRRHGREVDLQAANDKLGRLLFECRLRLFVSGPASAAKEAKTKLREMAAAFGQFHNPRLTSFKLSPVSRSRILQWLYRPAPFLLSAEEVATLWHLPTQSVKVSALAIVQCRAFDPPVNLPTVGKNPGISVLGVALGRFRQEVFGILADDRRKHLAVIGKTGAGKSTLLLNLLASDIRAGRMVGLIDPHGDLAEAVLPLVPRHRTNDVAYFDAGDREFPIAFNLLACANGDERTLVASGIVSAFKKLYGTELLGPRSEHILRNALLAVLEIPGSSLLTIHRLLRDARFRESVVARLSDPVVRAFWQQEFGSMSPRTQAEVTAALLNKIGHVLASPILRHIVGQARNRIDLPAILDSGILIANLSKGRMGEDASALLGSFLVTAIQLAALRRASLPEAARRQFFLSIDEFQTFATEAFPDMLSESRKYGLHVTLAHQHLSQLPKKTADAVLGNVGSIVAFQCGVQDAKVLAEQLGGDVRPEDLLSLPRFSAVVRLLIGGMPCPPLSMRTLPPPGISSRDRDRPDIIRRYCRQRYCRPATAVEAEISKQFAIP